jgi:hypothetical protein
VDDPQSKIELVKHGTRETVTALATVDDLIIYADGEAMVVEFVIWDARKKPLKGYRLTVCPEDAQRIRSAIKLPGLA